MRETKVATNWWGTIWRDMGLVRFDGYVDEVWEPAGDDMWTPEDKERLRLTVYQDQALLRRYRYRASKPYRHILLPAVGLRWTQ